MDAVRPGPDREPSEEIGRLPPGLESHILIYRSTVAAVHALPVDDDDEEAVRLNGSGVGYKATTDLPP